MKKLIIVYLLGIILISCSNRSNNSIPSATNKNINITISESTNEWEKVAHVQAGLTNGCLDPCGVGIYIKVVAGEKFYGAKTATGTIKTPQENPNKSWKNVSHYQYKVDDCYFNYEFK